MNFIFGFMSGYFVGTFYPKPRYYIFYYVPPFMNPDVRKKKPMRLIPGDPDFDEYYDRELKKYQEWKQKYYDDLLVKMTE